MPSKVIYGAANGKKFLWLSNIPLCMCVCVCVCICHIFFIHSPDDKHLGCFHTLVAVNRAVMNVGVHVSFRVSVLLLLCCCLDIYPGVEFLGHMVVLFLTF